MQDFGQFLLLGAKSPLKHLSRLYSNKMTSSLHRLLLEILKFLSAKELLGLSGLSHTWHRAVEAKEVWLCLLSGTGLEAWKLLQAEGFSPKSAYRKLYGRYVALIRGSELVVYRYQTEEWEVRQLPVSPTEAAILTPLEAGEMLCIGPMQPSDTCKIQVCSGTTKALGSRYEYRDFSGVCKVAQFVYSFAGKDSKLCEKLDLGSGLWQTIGQSLRARHAFNPAPCAPFIYLANGNCPSVESFHTQFLLFSEIKVKPALDTSVAAVVFEERLIAIGLHTACEWDLRSGQGRSRRLPQRPLRAWSSCQPVLEDGRVVLAWSYGGLCVVATLDLRSWEWRWHEAPSLK